MMKNFFIVVLLVHFVVEGLVSILLVGFPTEASPDSTVMEQVGLINQGFLTLTMASVVLWMWPYRYHMAAVSIGTGVLATFHTAISVSALLTTTMGNDPKPYLIHLVFAACFWLLWINRQRIVSAD